MFGRGLFKQSDVFILDLTGGEFLSLGEHSFNVLQLGPGVLKDVLDRERVGVGH